MEKNFLKNKSILVTGGTGSFGQKLVLKLINEFNLKKIVIYSRDELKQFEMKNNFNENNDSELDTYNKNIYHEKKKLFLVRPSIE